MLRLVICNLILCCALFIQINAGFYGCEYEGYSYRRIRGSEGIVFKDANLESIIREIIQKPTGVIKESDLNGITKVDLSNKGIKNLEGIEHLVNLKELYLSNNKISGISALEIVLKRGLDEFTIDGNNLNIADYQKFADWMQSGQKNMALADNLKKLGYHSVPVIKGDLVFTNDVYDLTARDGCVVKVSTAVSGKVLWEADEEGIRLVDDIRMMNLPGGKTLVFMGANGVFEIPLSSQDD